MRIHHLNCVSSCPLGGFLMDGATKDSLRGRLVNHCLLLESEQSLMLVDTGYGIRDVREPRKRLSKVFYELLKPQLREEMTAVRQIEALGFRARDVRHIILSHLDFDHAGGLDDFPEATVHVLADEVLSATARRTPLDRMRYRPQQWGSSSRWQEHPLVGGESWFGFDGVRAVEALDARVLLVPLIGHTLGHAGVAIQRAGGWLLYAADAYFYHAEIDPERAHCTPGLAAYQRLMEKDRAARLQNQQRLRDLRRNHGGQVEVFCAHDYYELERVSGRGHAEPVQPLAAAPRDQTTTTTPRS
jgi:glyoxylase-like metal-dependent hydrolase (beta-lactamase superfamily II)